jgi:hypothetical protein
LVAFAFFFAAISILQSTPPTLAATGGRALRSASENIRPATPDAAGLSCSCGYGRLFGVTGGITGAGAGAGAAFFLRAEAFLRAGAFFFAALRTGRLTAFFTDFLDVFLAAFFVVFLLAFLAGRFLPALAFFAFFFDAMQLFSSFDLHIPAPRSAPPRMHGMCAKNPTRLPGAAREGAIVSASFFCYAMRHGSLSR